MKLSAHQPVCLGGYLGHFAKLAWCDEWVIFDVCPMEDSGFENRQRIKTAQGPLMLTVPTHRARAKSIAGVGIDGDHWRKKHWRSIEAAYRKAPFWSDYAEIVCSFYERPWYWLVDLNSEIFLCCAKFLGLHQGPMHYASQMNLTGTKSDLVLDMCRKAGATEYLFGPNGKDYADVAAFRAAGIEPRFQDYKHPVYPQLHGDFVPNLSVLDLLFNCGPKSRDILLSNGYGV